MSRNSNSRSVHWVNDQNRSPKMNHHTSRTTPPPLGSRPGDDLAQIFDDFYVDLDDVRTEHGFDPVAALKGRQDFGELLEVFNRLADRHTLLSLPNTRSLLTTNRAAACYPRPAHLIDAARNGIARLPVRIERSTVDANDRFWITRLHADAPGALRTGSEVTHWNGVPIAIAAETQGRALRGGHADARRALGLRSLPQRLVGSTLIPNEDWTLLTCLEKGRHHEVRLDWKPEPATLQATSERAPWRHVLHQTKTGDGFRCGLLNADTKRDHGDQVPAYVRLFDVPEWPQLGQLVDWLRSVTASPHRRNLVLDLRGNPGGSVETADHLVRLLGGDQQDLHEPTHFQFRNTPGVRRTLGAHPKWRHCAVPHRARTLAPHPMTCSTSLQELPPLTLGAIVIIVDALTYSAAEILVAQLRRRPDTLVVGADPQTGAGTANAWSFHTLHHLSRSQGHHVIPPLRQGLELQLAVRRAVIRDGDQWAPIPLQQVEHLVPISKDDLLHGNRDLLRHAAQLLRRDDTVSPRAQNHKKDRFGSSSCRTKETEV